MSWPWGTYQESLAKKINFKDWHNRGWDGSGTVCLELEEDHSHASVVVQNARVINTKGKILLLPESYFGYPDKILQFIKDNHVQIVAMSCHVSRERYEPMAKAIYDMGIPFGISAGNDGDEITYDQLASSPYVFSTGLLNTKWSKDTCSEYGKALDFITGEFFSHGTSFSDPIIWLGMAPLVFQRYDKMKPEQIYAWFARHSIDFGEQGFDKLYGWGMPVFPGKDKDMKIVLKAGSKESTVNGSKIELRNAPYIIDNPGVENDETMIGLRFISEALGLKCTYNNTTKEITLEG